MCRLRWKRWVVRGAESSGPYRLALAGENGAQALDAEQFVHRGISPFAPCRVKRFGRSMTLAGRLRLP